MQLFNMYIEQMHTITSNACLVVVEGNTTDEVTLTISSMKKHNML